MPAGLTDTLTRGELVDLVRFLSELGKIGPYAVGKDRVFRRWQVLRARRRGHHGAGPHEPGRRGPEPCVAGLGACLHHGGRRASPGETSAHSPRQDSAPGGHGADRAGGLRSRVGGQLAFNAMRGADGLARRPAGRARAGSPEPIVEHRPRGAHTLTVAFDPADRTEGVRCHARGGRRLGSPAQRRPGQVIDVSRRTGQPRSLAGSGEWPYDEQGRAGPRLFRGDLSSRGSAHEPRDQPASDGPRIRATHAGRPARSAAGSYRAARQACLLAVPDDLRDLLRRGTRLRPRPCAVMSGSFRPWPKLAIRKRSALSTPWARGMRPRWWTRSWPGPVRPGPSDVHLHPATEGLDMRWRIDGVLQPVAVLPRELAPNVVARLKVLAELLTYRTDVPQEGRIRGVARRGRDAAQHVPDAPRREGRRPPLRRPRAVTSGSTTWACPPRSATPCSRLLDETSGAVVLSRPGRQRQDDDALRLPARAGRRDRGAAQPGDAGGPDRGRPSPGSPSRRSTRRAGLDARERACGRCCGRTPRSSPSARSATGPPPRSPSRRRSPATSS